MKKTFIIITLMLLSFHGFAGNYGSNILKVSDNSKLRQYNNPEAVVTGKQAKELIEKSVHIVVFDVRKPIFFATGHIPGAVNIWRTDISADKGTYDFEGMTPSKEKIRKLLSDNGVRTHTKVLIYDANGNYDSARLWWILKLYGHKNMSLIDGGLQGWKSSKLPVEYGFGKTPRKTNYIYVRRGDRSNFASLKEVKDIVYGRRNGIIIDARAKENIIRIPKSNLVPWKSAIYLNNKGFSYSLKKKTQTKKFKTIKELKKIYGKYKNKNIIVYSQSGIGSAHTTFVLSELLGYNNVKNYDGSWVEWSHHKELKVETD